MKLEDMTTSVFFNDVVTLNLVLHLNQVDKNRRVTWLARQYYKKYQKGRAKRAMGQVLKNQRKAGQVANAMYTALSNSVEGSMDEQPVNFLR